MYSRQDFCLEVYCAVLMTLKTFWKLLPRWIFSESLGTVWFLGTLHKSKLHFLCVSELTLMWCADDQWLLTITRVMSITRSMQIEKVSGFINSPLETLKCPCHFLLQQQTGPPCPADLRPPGIRDVRLFHESGRDGKHSEMRDRWRILHLTLTLRDLLKKANYLLKRLFLAVVTSSWWCQLLTGILGWRWELMISFTSSFLSCVIYTLKWI